ncbi:MAG: hypothetical protein N2170_06050 [Bacteroidia bacterium]|nr:hypothetical protein [Bacteroidia bacterium]
MPQLTIYLGLFTGAIVTGMGIYLYVHPLSSDLPLWIAQGLPGFMIGYGVLRLGFTLYQLFRKPQKRNSRSTPPLGAWLLFSLFMQYCSFGPEANMRIRLDYAGDCASCPLSRMDSLLHVFFPKGIVAISYDSTHHQVLIDTDSQAVSLDSLRHVLLAYGYEVNEEFPFDPILSPCCTNPLESASKAGEPSFILSPSVETQEEMSLLEREIEEGLGQEGGGAINLDAELNLDGDITELEDLNLDEDISPDDMALDELELEEDLGLDEGTGSGGGKKSPPRR